MFFFNRGSHRISRKETWLSSDLFMSLDLKIPKMLRLKKLQSRATGSRKARKKLLELTILKDHDSLLVGQFDLKDKILILDLPPLLNLNQDADSNW